MARKKRSEKLAEAAVRPVPTPIEAPAAERIVSAHCPVCGKAIQETKAVKVGHATVGKVDYFSSIDWDPNKPFGTSYRAGGRNSFRDNYPIKPEDAPELFEAVKNRLLQALREWVAKGWIKEEELATILG